MSSTAVRRAIYGRLSSDTTLSNLLGAAAPGYSKGIYYQVAPEGAAFPYVVFQHQSGVPTEAMQDPSAYETDVWLVKAVDRNTSADTAESIAARIQTLLNDATLTISGATHLYLRRQSDVDYPEVDEGIQYKHCGALYRLIFDPT
jgi:hypothetical protein